MSLVQRATRRLSGGKLPLNNRVTMDMRDMLGFLGVSEREKAEAVQNLEIIKENSNARASLKDQ